MSVCKVRAGGSPAGGKLIKNSLALWVVVAIMSALCFSTTLTYGGDSDLGDIGVYFSTYDQGLFRLQLPEGEVEHVLTAEQLPAISTDDQKLAYWSDAQLWVTELAHWSPQPTPITLVGAVTSIDWLPNDTRILITHEPDERDLAATVAFNVMTNEFEPWAWDECDQLERKIDSGDFVFVCLDRVDSTPLATMTWQGELQEYDGANLMTFSRPAGRHLANQDARFDFSQDGTIVAYIEEDGIGIDEYLYLTTSADYMLKVNLFTLDLLRFSPDDSLLASVNMPGGLNFPESLYIWETESACPLWVLRLDFAVRDLTWYPDASKIMTVIHNYNRTYFQIVNIEDQNILEYDILGYLITEIAVVQEQ